MQKIDKTNEKEEYILFVGFYKVDSNDRILW